MRAVALIGLISALAACAPPPGVEPRVSTPADAAELWQEPVDLDQRDLRAGPGGSGLAPQPSQQFTFVAFKTSGTNPGYDVRDSSGRLWSVKLGIEAQSEVTVSRILWALGYHQPPTYYLRQFTLTGSDGDDGLKQQARFRTDADGWTAGGEWSWYENPFVGTRPFRGLVVAQLILNAWDLKTPNNTIYEAADPAIGQGRRFVVRDVGASLGRARQFALFTALGTRGWQGTKNDVDDFEGQGFITSVHGDDVEFDYRGVNQPLVDTVSAADVVWICERFARIPDSHWRAAFAAGDYAPEDAERYIRKIKDKIAQGLALKRDSATTR